MKIHPTCVPCLLKRVLFEANQCNATKTQQQHAIKQACRLISELYSSDICSADLATKVHKQVYSILETDDPYKELKQQSNEVAQSLVPRAEEYIQASEDPLQAAMLCSIIGNMMDFGIAGASETPQDLLGLFNTSLQEGLGYSDYPQVHSLIENAQNLVLFTDNCGEIVFDKLLCREIKRFHPECMLTVVVKGEPVLSDATLEDAEEIQLHEYVNAILTTGCFAVGVNVTSFPSNVLQSLQETDLILCKGMANYEAFSETDYHPIAYFMRTKCAPIATSMGVPVHANVIKLFE